jgi:hypothetical protein
MGTGARVKLSSVLSPVQESLDEQIWNGERLKPEVKNFCLEFVNDFLMHFVEEEEVFNLLKRVYLIGSITGYQYDPDADLDINILVDLDALSDLLDVEKELLIYEMRRKVGEVNGKRYPGTEHPANIFLSTEEGYPPADGIYDLFTDVWLKKPGHPGDIDPYENLKNAIDRAEEIAEKVDAKWGALTRLYQEITRYPKSELQIKRQVIRVLRSLKRILKNVVTERRESFEIAKMNDQPAPQTGVPNIVYKYLEYNGLLDKLHEADHWLRAYDETGMVPEIITAAMNEGYQSSLIMENGEQIFGDKHDDLHAQIANKHGIGYSNFNLCVRVYEEPTSIAFLVNDIEPWRGPSEEQVQAMAQIAQQNPGKSILAEFYDSEDEDGELVEGYEDFQYDGDAAGFVDWVRGQVRIASKASRRLSEATEIRNRGTGREPEVEELTGDSETSESKKIGYWDDDSDYYADWEDQEEEDEITESPQPNSKKCLVTSKETYFCDYRASHNQLLDEVVDTSDPYLAFGFVEQNDAGAYILELYPENEFPFPPEPLRRNLLREGIGIVQWGEPSIDGTGNADTIGTFIFSERGCWTFELDEDGDWMAGEQVD